MKQISLDFGLPAGQPAPAEEGKDLPPQQAAQEPVEPIVVDEVLREVEIEPVKVEEPIITKKTGRGRMKLSDMQAEADKVDVPDDEILFQKSYYSIGTVSEMFKVNISLIRFWENEFDILKPKKNGKGDRLFRPEDVKNLRLIYSLLRERKYTIEGAKTFLKKQKQVEARAEVIDALQKLRAFMLDLKTNL